MWPNRNSTEDKTEKEVRTNGVSRQESSRCISVLVSVVGSFNPRKRSSLRVGIQAFFGARLDVLQLPLLLHFDVLVRMQVTGIL